MAFRKLDRLSFVLGFCAIVAGCGGASDAPQTVQVKGVVKYQGKPVPKLSVGFIPEKGMLASGKTDDQGRFTLTTNKTGDGAMVGNYKVAISFVPDEVPVMPGFPGSDKPPPASPIPKKYANAETSGLTKTVSKNASENDFTFELTD